jgi:ribulose 1,5-bisphosphate synthetase/thiazole synthase
MNQGSRKEGGGVWGGGRLITCGNVDNSIFLILDNFIIFYLVGVVAYSASAPIARAEIANPTRNYIDF